MASGGISLALASFRAPALTPPAGAELSEFDLNELEKLAVSWGDENFDTLLAGFDKVDLDALLHPANDAPAGDDSQAGDLEKGNVTVSIGLYRFEVTQEEFGVWSDAIRQEVGFDKAAVIKAIREKLGL